MKHILLLILSCIQISISAQEITQVLKAMPSKRLKYDFNGYSVSISGKYAIVGAYGNSEDANDSDFKSMSGAAFI